MADETKTDDPIQAMPTLAAQSGVSAADAALAIKAMNDRFDKMAEENGQLKRMIVAQQAQIEKMNAGTAAQKYGKVPIVLRHCNACGAEVDEGARCPNKAHKNQKINEVGMSMKHGRMQPVIVRQV